MFSKNPGSASGSGNSNFLNGVFLERVGWELDFGGNPNHDPDPGLLPKNF